MTHPELARIEDLVRRLQDGMDEGGEDSGKSLFALASDYADLSRKANDRLQTCVEILSQGKDKEYQALMTATRAPDVLDLCAVLGELDADEYRVFCKQHHLPVAEPLNERAKQTIDPIYERAGTFQKALMAEFSAANSKRDFKEALRVIRRVATLNPDDINSVKQAAALEDRLILAEVSKLEKPLRDGDSDLILESLTEIEELAPGRIPKEDDKRHEPWRRALEMRDGLRRDAAIQESEGLMEEAKAAREGGQLNEVLGLISRVSGLMEMHDFTLKPNLRNLHAELSEWSSEEIRKLKLEQEYQGRLGTLQQTVKQIRDKDFQNVKPTLAELQEDALGIRKQWKEIAEFQKPVSNELQEEARKLLGDLEEKISLKLRAKRRNLISAVTAGAALLIFLSVLAFFLWKAGQKSEQIERALAGERASDLERNLKELEIDSPLWKGLAGLPSTVEKAQTWLTLEKSNADRVDEMITAIENDLKAVPDPQAWSEVSLVAVRNALDQSREQSGQVNADFQSDMADRLSSLERQYERITGEKRNQIAPKFHQDVIELDRRLRETMTSGKSPDDANAAFTEMSALISSLDTIAGSELEELRPLPADLTTFEILKQKYGSLESEMETVREVMTGIESASNLSEYVVAMTALEESDILQGTEKIALGSLLRKVRSEDALLREILMPGDLVVWTKLVEDRYSETGFPLNVEGAEKGLFLGLRDDEALGKIHSYSVSEAGNNRMVYSKGEPMNFRNSKIGTTTQIEAIGGKVYDPAKMGNSSAVFESVNYRARVSSSGGTGFVPTGGKLSNESTFFQSLRLGGYVDPTVSSFRESLLRAVEDVYAAGEEISPLFKGYVQLKLGEILNSRREAWLLDFTGFGDDFEELKSITDNGALTSSSWMVPDEVQSYNEVLSAFYRKRQGRKFAKPALALYQFYARMEAAGINYCGYIGFDGKPELVKESVGANRIWGLDEELTVTRVLEREDGEWRPLSGTKRFSPLFTLPSKPDSVVEAAASTSGIAIESPEFQERLPRMFRATGE